MHKIPLICQESFIIVNEIPHVHDKYTLIFYMYLYPVKNFKRKNNSYCIHEIIYRRMVYKEKVLFADLQCRDFNPFRRSQLSRFTTVGINRGSHKNHVSTHHKYTFEKLAFFQLYKLFNFFISNLYNLSSFYLSFCFTSILSLPLFLFYSQVVILIFERMNQKRSVDSSFILQRC